MCSLEQKPSCLHKNTVLHSRTLSFLLFLVQAPRESLYFVIPAFGGTVSWEGEGAPFEESGCFDRATTGLKFLSREYIQPRWMYDCVNARIVLPTEKYMPGCVPPPHLSPFVDNESDGHIPQYVEAIELLKAAERKEVLPFPGMGKEDFDDLQSLLGIIDRAEAIEAAKRKQKISAKEKLYHVELKLELQGTKYSTVPREIVDTEGDDVPDQNQRAEDDANISKGGNVTQKGEASRSNGDWQGERERFLIHRVKERKKKILEAKKVSA